MLKQLLLCKRLFTESNLYAERGDSVSSGLAASLLQDSAELFVWTLIKEKGVSVKDGAPFTGNLESLRTAGFPLQHGTRLLDLNKARIGFKHYGNLPATEEVSKYKKNVEEFLCTGFKQYFEIDFDELSLVDLVNDVEIQGRLKEAERLILESDFQAAITQIAITRVILFARLKGFIPTVDSHLKEGDTIISGMYHRYGFKLFSFISDYMGRLREAILVSLLRLPLQDYAFLNKELPVAVITMSGEWSTRINNPEKYDEKICRRAILCLVNVAIRLESIL